MRISRDEMLRNIAGDVADRGTCSRAKVGVVLAREGRVLVTGYNGAPAGMTHCDHPCDCGFSLGLRSMHKDECKSRKPCTIAVHAEANAIAYAARYGISVEGAEMFTTLSPCLSCAQLLINAGIIRVVSMREYRDQSGLELLRKAGIVLE